MQRRGPAPLPVSLIPAVFPPADPIFARSLAAEEEERKALSRGLASADIETVVAAAIALYCLARAGHADGASPGRKATA